MCASKESIDAQILRRRLSSSLPGLNLLLDDDIDPHWSVRSDVRAFSELMVTSEKFDLAVLHIDCEDVNSGASRVVLEGGEMAGVDDPASVVGQGIS